MMRASVLCRVGLGLLVAAPHVQADATTEGPYGGTAATVPGLIQAEAFDYGGQLVGYSETTPANIPAEFRLDEAVDVRAVGLAYVVEDIARGEFLRYTVDVTEAVVAFDFNFRVASETGLGSLRVVSGGERCWAYNTDLSGPVMVPNTGGSHIYQDFAVSGVANGALGGLGAGEQAIYLCMESAGFTIDSFTMTKTTPQGPYRGVPTEIPGNVMAILFDYGDGVGYSDSTPTNIYNVYRTGEAVDIFIAAVGRPAVSAITAGEYLRYTVNVAADVAAFMFSFMVASDAEDGSKFRIVSGGTDCTDYDTDLSGLVTAPKTEGIAASDYKTIVVSGEGNGGLDAGINLIRLCAESDGLNILIFSMAEEVVEPTPAPTLGGGAFGGMPSMIPGIIEAERFDDGGEGVGYSDTTAANKGGELRTGEGVDIDQFHSGYKVSSIAKGEYLRYTVHVVEDVGAFFFIFRVASKKGGGSVRVVSGGNGCDDYETDLSGLVSLPSTKGWNKFESHRVSGQGNGGLGAGPAVIWLCVVSKGFHIDSFTMSNEEILSTPYSSTPVTIPGVVEAEEYDNGGQGLAYDDTGVANKGKVFRINEGVDIKKTVDGYSVGWTKAGEFINYTVTVLSAVAMFDFNFRISGPKTNPGSFRIVTGGMGCDDYATDLSGLVSAPADGGSRYSDISINGGPGGLPAGVAVIRLCVVTPRFNIDSFGMTEHTYAR